MTAADQPWTIERIDNALSSIDLSRRFQEEMYSAPAYELLLVFAKWQAIAGRLQASAERLRAAAEAEAAGRSAPGVWADWSEQICSVPKGGRSRA